MTDHVFPGSRIAAHAWIGYDLDGTLAEWGPGTSNPLNVMIIGNPVPRMVQRCKDDLAAGHQVRIFTARLGPATDAECQNNSSQRCQSLGAWRGHQTEMIEAWCLTHLGAVLPITHEKDWHLFQMYDDRCIQVAGNLGVTVEEALGYAIDHLAHYAQLLNQWDGGQRTVFRSAEEWIARLEELSRV